MPATDLEDAAGMIDRRIGERLRTLRTANGLTQSELGQALAVSFQQINKYEKGVNRISAGKLYRAAQLLRVGIDAFDPGLAEAPEMLMRTDPNGVRLAEAFVGLSAPQRQILVEVALAMRNQAVDATQAA